MFLKSAQIEMLWFYCLMIKTDLVKLQVMTDVDLFFQQREKKRNY